MRLYLLLMSLLFAVFASAGCGGGGGGGETQEEEVPIGVSIPDPVTPVPIDVTIGGVFEDEPFVPPPPIVDEPQPPITYRDAETNTLSREEIESAPDFEVSKFIEAFELTQNERPDLSTSSNEFARIVISKLSQTGDSGTEDGNKLKGVFGNNISPEEVKLLLRNMSKAYKTFQARSEAIAATAALFSPDAWADRGDAFRHSYWNWLMSACCGVEWATAFATAHESQEKEGNDKRMDLNNNMVGRRLFSNAPSATPAQAQDALLDHPVLWINTRLKNVTVGVDYLVYLLPAQAMKVFDDGPDYDDIFTVFIDGSLLGDTPKGNGRDFQFDQLPSGTRPLNVICKLDGTQGGCGFQVRITGALTMENGSKFTNQIVMNQGEMRELKVKFPTMRHERKD